MRLTLFTDYSLRVLLVLATRTESLVTIADLSKAFAGKVIYANNYAPPATTALATTTG